MLAHARARACDKNVCIVLVVLFVKCYFNCYRCTVHFEIYVVHSPTNALFN